MDITMTRLQHSLTASPRLALLPSHASQLFPMHPTPARMLALVNQDILRLIFCYLRIMIDPSNATKLTKLALFRATLACRAFMEPALDSLWWPMTSLTC
ncbi:hypothetical protein BD779DRAFT_867637 [Infundibulicybe gibba]|nr:hypothetical protein BD779DRAFT_867637 [Infundibulicybe gibba]